MSENTHQTASSNIIDITFKEIRSYENDSVMLTENVSYSQYQTIQTNKTHQNNGFLTQLAEGQEDDRRFDQIITPMIQTTTVNVDIDSEHFDIFTVGERHQAQAFLGRSLLLNYLKQTNHGEKINATGEAYCDDGNIVARKVNKDGEIYKLVQLQNLYVIDTTAETLEDTTVIEKAILNQTQLRQLKSLGFKRLNDVVNSCDLSKKSELPYYELFFRYGEILESDLENIKEDLANQDEQAVDKSIDIHKEKDGEYESQDNYVQGLVVIARAKKGKKEPSQLDSTLNDTSKGIIVFAEKLIPEEIKITENLIIKKYKPYEEAHFGEYMGRWLRIGLREVGVPFQNTANEISNKIRSLINTAKLVFWTTDERIAGRNIISSIEDGQILIAKDLQLLNNTFPNLQLFASEWNKNIENAQRALKAFEVATGESTPSSASATAIAVQNQAVGKYFNYKHEKLGLFFTSVFKRWVIPEILENTKTQDVIEIIGDPSYMEEYYDSIAEGFLLNNGLKTIALNGGSISPESYEQVKQLKKEELMKNSKSFLPLEKDFFKSVELYVGINPTGEIWNKQNKITNGLQLLQYIANPTIMDNPEARDIVVDIAGELGIKVKPKPSTQQVNPQAQTSAPGQPARGQLNNEQTSTSNEPQNV